jgi:hypothetical protein
MNLVEMIDDGAAIDQCLAVVEHQGWDAAKWIGVPHGGPAFESRQRPLLERHAIGLERDRDAARERRTIHTDQQHRGSDSMAQPSRAQWALIRSRAYTSSAANFSCVIGSAQQEDVELRQARQASIPPGRFRD